MLFYKAVFIGLLLWAVYVPLALVSSAEEEEFFALQDIPSDKEELKVQESFPLYRVDFSHKLVQEEVYKEFLKERKEKEKQ